MIGDTDPGVDSVINYQTGQAVVTFSGPIVNALNNITADLEHQGLFQPIDIRVSYSLETL
jgi:hypothetical protein